VRSFHHWIMPIRIMSHKFSILIFCVRAGHHCAMPLQPSCSVPATTRPVSISTTSWMK
jgi:hypothetical protein